MAQITVTLTVDEDIIKNESGQENLTDAIGQELGWLRDSGMYVDKWSYVEPEKEKAAPAEEQTVESPSPVNNEVDELVVRLSYYAGTLEARKEISSPEWSELCSAIADCITVYYYSPNSRVFSSIEEVADKIFKASFPLEPTQQEEKGPSDLIVGAPEEFTVRLAHLAGELEANSHIVAVEWDDLTAAIQALTNAYLNDQSESINPFDLEDAGERYFIAQFGTEEFREAAISEGWINKTPSEFIEEAKMTKREVPNIPLEAPAPVEDQTPQMETYEDDKVLFRDKKTGELWFHDCFGKDDFIQEFEEDMPYILGNKDFECIGVYTSPETVCVSHPCNLSAIWNDIPADYQDQATSELLSGLRSGKQYDVCYYYTKSDDPSSLYYGVDLQLSRNTILENIAANKYMEGAVIYESDRILTPEEYLSGMRGNSNECKRQMSREQLEEVRLGVENGISETQLLRPNLSPAELLKLRTELETEMLRKWDPYAHFEATDYGPQLLEPCFKSESNFAKYPDRVCYIPENWDFEIDGPGVTGQSILDLCGGDKLKAEIVFDLCDWQHPTTILNEWDHEDDLALEARRAKLTQPKQRHTFSDLLRGAKDRAAAQQQSQRQDPAPHR